MKRTCLLGLAVFIMGGLSFAGGGNQGQAHDRASLERFVAAHLKKTATPPFAFIYGGKPSSEFLAKWASLPETQSAGDGITETVVYRDPSTKLRITAAYTLHPDFPAVEWVLRFKNEGTSDTPVIADVLSCAVRFDDWPQGPSTLYRALGSDAQRSDFAPVRDDLSENAEVRFGPSRGRSSDATAFPFFNIAAPDRGIVAAIGWTGRWKASVKKAGLHSLRLEAGMERTRFRLKPGEEVRSPSIALLFWTGGDRMSGHNLFRRFVLAHHTPRPQGRPVELPLSHGVGFGGPFPCNE